MKSELLLVIFCMSYAYYISCRQPELNDTLVNRLEEEEEEEDGDFMDDDE